MNVRWVFRRGLSGGDQVSDGTVCPAHCIPAGEAYADDTGYVVFQTMVFVVVQILSIDESQCQGC